MNPNDEERTPSFWENIAYWTRIIESLFHISNAAVQIYSVYSETTTKGFENPVSEPPRVAQQTLNGEDNEPKEGEPICAVCITNAVKTVITPCNHAVLCLSCARRYQNDNVLLCPLCKTNITGIGRLYFG